MSTPPSAAGTASDSLAEPTLLSASWVRHARTTVILELGKLRRRHYWLLAASASALCLVWSSMRVASRVTGPAKAHDTTLALDELLQVITVLMPVVTALLASRIVTADTEERMGQLMTALGQRPLTRYRGKLVIVFLTASAMETAVLVLLAAAAAPLGLTVTTSYWRALPPALVVMACSALAVASVQLMLSMCFDRQAIGLGTAAVGGLIAGSLPHAYLGSFTWLLPWGIIPSATPIDTVASYASIHATGDMTLATQPWILAVFAALAATGWTVVAHTAIVHRVNYR